MDSSEKKVSVAVRIRPRLPVGIGSRVQQEEYQHPNCLIVQDDTTLRLQEQKQDENCKSSIYTFDYVFDTDCMQSEVYEEAVQELVDTSLSGANCTILAYGQTGSGKTHTVLGQVKSNPLEDDLLMPESGLFLRCLKDLFEYKKRREDKAWVVIALSCIEIYLDNARDLLSYNPGENIKIQITDDDVKMPTLTRFEILNLNDVYKHFKEASKHRTTRATDANDASSRSHCLFVIDIVQQDRTDKNPAQPDISFLKDPALARTKPPKKDRSASPATASPKGPSPSQNLENCSTVIYKKDEPPIVASKIVLADLAGSEKSSGKTGSGATAGSAMFKEMTSINKSLTALGNVAHALHSGANYVPYRDATLTKILRPSFASPASKILLISNLSPTQLTYDESFSTLQFANKVKAMKVSSGLVGADQQQLQFEFLETQKANWALLADLHISQLHFENEPMLRRFTDVIVPPFNTHRLKLKSQEKERQKLIKDLEPQGREEKVRIAEKIARRKEQEAQQMQEMKKEIFDGLIDEFTNKVGTLQAQIDAMDTEASEFHAKLNADITQRADETKEHETTYNSLCAEKKQLRTDIESMVKTVQKLIEERAHLNEEEKKSKSENQHKQTAAELSLTEAENKYVASMWGHCKAQQYYFRFKAYRETLSALIEAQKQNILRIDLAVKESEKLAKMLK